MLLVSREQAEKVLNEQIELAQELAAQADVAEQWNGWDYWQHRYAKWRDNTIARLRTVYLDGDGDTSIYTFEIATIPVALATPQASFNGTRSLTLATALYLLRRAVAMLPLADEPEVTPAARSIEVDKAHRTGDMAEQEGDEQPATGQSAKQVTSISGLSHVDAQTTIGQARDVYIGTNPRFENEPTPLHLVFESGNPPYVQHGHMFLRDETTGIETRTSGVTYRVGVKNSGGRTVDKARVRLVAVDPLPTVVVLPITLRKKDDNLSPYSSSLGFSVDPNDIEYVDVIMKSDGQRDVQVQHTASGVTRVFLPNPCIITLSATGRDVVASVAARFNVSVSPDGTLEMSQSDAG